jgi:hypothetical protein
MVYQENSQARKQLLQQLIEFTDYISENDKIIRKEINYHLDSQNCAYRNVDAILIIIVAT